MAQYHHTEPSAILNQEQDICVLLRVTGVLNFYCTHCSEQNIPSVLQRPASAGAVLRNWGEWWEQQGDIYHNTETL